MEFKKDCVDYSGRKKNCPVSEKGRTYRIINESDFEVTIYKVDSCLISDNDQQKCDYLLLVNEGKTNRAYFVELKGTGLSDAIQQISSSIDILGKHLQNYKVFGRIIGKGFTPNIKSRTVKLDEKLKQLGGDLKIACCAEYKEVI